ncbi:MAG: Rrf2 family transcriptional regulator [Pirellulales bacterium]|nr:Rrf2 family transcriptional regulator [Pirellulales bacterium]
MISQTAEYALRAVVYLADHADRPHTAREIAKASHVPLGYLSKVLQELVRAGLVASQRGLHGGFRLARSPAKLTVWDVIQAVDPIRRIRTCPLGLKAHGANLCPMHHRLDQAMAMVEEAFRSSTVAELLAEPTSSKPLCPFPHTKSCDHRPVPA